MLRADLASTVSRARPRIASYPFTTLRPNVGTIEYNDFSRLVMADIPGLIQGAAENRGMGHAFLRHVERTHVSLSSLVPCLRCNRLSLG